MAELQESAVKAGGDSIIVQMVKCAGKVAQTLGKPAIILLDAYFYRRTTLETAAQYTDSAGKPILKIITRAKRCAVGYTLPPERTGKKGRPRLYGDKISLMEVFSSHAAEFTTTTMRLYGRTKAAQYLCLDLLQRPTRQLVRFVLTKVHGTPFILMSTDLSLTPEEIITLYTLRFKIEGMFGELKHELGGFRYHFWTSALEKRKRGEAAVLPTDKEGIRLVAQAKKAINVYVCLHCIAQAILTVLALTHSRDIWGRFSGWLRIVRTEEPTVMVTKQVVTQEFHANSTKLSRFPAFQAVIDVMRSDDFLYKKSS